MTTNGAEKLKKMEQKLKKLSNVSIEARHYGYNYLGSKDFHEWIRASKGLKDPDVIRNALYYGFQPLYDCLVENRIRGDQRKAGLYALGKIIDTGVKFLASYYMGEADPMIFTEGVSQADVLIERLDGAVYKTKSRNIDINGIYPKDILSFTRQFIEYCIDGKAPVPDHVIGCACGSSEIAMPLAGIVEADLSFIRRSKRRDDNKPKIIKEHKDDIRGRTQGRSVLCVEDYVCTGESLLKVMNAASKYSPSELRGASVNNCMYQHLPGLFVNTRRHKFHMYRMERDE